MYSSFSPPSIIRSPPSPFAQAHAHAHARVDAQTLYPDPWHTHQHHSLSSESAHTSSNNSSSEHSSPTPTSPEEHEQEHDKILFEKSTKLSKIKRSKPAEPPTVLSKTGKRILAASLKRQLRRQKARAKAEPRYIELADGQKLGLGQRRSKYTAILEKLNLDLARVQTELQHEKQRNQQLDDTVDHLNQQLNQQTPHSTELQSISQIKTQLMYQHSIQSIYDFFKMSSPVMLVLLDFNFRVLDANQTYLRENGWTRDELIGRRLPLVQMSVFFIPGYDQKLIPIDEQDIPPLLGGLPRGISVEQMHVNPSHLSAYHNLYGGKADSITVRDTYLDGKGRLYQSNITHWLAYYKPDDDLNHDTARVDDRTSMPMALRSRSAYVWSRPLTKADEAFRTLIGRPNPPHLPHKGYPKYHVAMECAYDREYIMPICMSTSPHPLAAWNSSASLPSCSMNIREADHDTESDVDDEHGHQPRDHTNLLPWTETTQPLHTIAKIADRFAAWRRTIRANRATTGICTSALGMYSATRTISSPTSAAVAPMDDDFDEELLLPPNNPACAHPDAGAIVSVLVQKAKNITTMRKLIKKGELEPLHGDGDVVGDGVGDAQSTTEAMHTNQDRDNQITMATPDPRYAEAQPQVQVPMQIAVPVPHPVHAPIQTFPQPSTSFPHYSPLDLPLATSPPPAIPLSVYDSDLHQDMCIPSLTLTSQSSYESLNRTFPYRAPSPFSSIWGNSSN